MIELEQVSKHYPNGRDALSEVTLKVGRGEMAFLTGHSGAGKSTLLKLLALIERPTRGSLRVNGNDLARLDSRHVPRHRRGIGMIFQDHRLLADRSVYDNVALPLIVAGAPRREIDKRVRAALDRVGLLGWQDERPVTLSGGEQQRVGIARAVVHKPPLLLADEPTGNLDPELSQEIMGLFETFSRVGVTVLIASHDADLIHRMDHRILRLEQGRLI